jgi:hypothetical protein
MSNNTIKLEEITKENPFRTPEGFFENLTANILSHLPERSEEEIKVMSFWERIQPWVYMAALFAGIALMINLFVGLPPNLNLTSSTDIEDFYQYYEEQLTNNVYHEALFLLSDDYEY